ncbi:uncharacterized protein K02A2.6 [Trichonephila clavipes]|nr:uncharacterized protein K02A2.6 [Trichonephila clavipes]
MDILEILLDKALPENCLKVKEIFSLFNRKGTMEQQIADLLRGESNRPVWNRWTPRLESVSLAEDCDRSGTATRLMALPCNGRLIRALQIRDDSHRKFDVGDRVAVRVYRAANTRWKFGTIVNQDGVLHYIIDVQGTLVRRHVDQIRPVGDKSARKHHSTYAPEIPIIRGSRKQL